MYKFKILVKLAYARNQTTIKLDLSILSPKLSNVTNKSHKKNILHLKYYSNNSRNPRLRCNFGKCDIGNHYVSTF